MFKSFIIGLTFVLFFNCVSLFAIDAQVKPITSDTPKGAKEINVNNELSMLDNLIEVTQQSVDSQKKLRDLIRLYQTLQTQYLQNEDDKELLYKIVRVAYLASESIKENHLSQIFDPDFLKELNLFAQIAAKRGIPKP